MEALNLHQYQPYLYPALLTSLIRSESLYQVIHMRGYVYARYLYSGKPLRTENALNWGQVCTFRPSSLNEGRSEEMLPFY